MLFDFVELDNSNTGAMYIQLYEQVKSAIESGIIKRAEKLPSVREAAAQLDISRTTAESAYTRLCIEGYIESRPQRGYFVCGALKKSNITSVSPVGKANDIKFDFSSRKVDINSADTELWRKIVRSVLTDSEQLISYGDEQGEEELRRVLCDYSFKARGVYCEPQNIIVGAGIGPLLNILCGLTGNKIKVGFEFDGFNLAEQIFSDYGIEYEILESDKNGATLNGLRSSKSDILFLLPSALSKISVNSLASRRSQILNWVSEKDNRLIIEDDYNGELRYTARTVASLQSKSTENIIYIGSFSKLLLPSVRIAYMVLPNYLLQKFIIKRKYYNQTCGKTEQLALCRYISSGALEKHLKRLRKLYYIKSHILCDALEKYISGYKGCTLYETSTTVELETNLKIKSTALCEAALKCGINVMPSKKDGAVRLCFSGLNTSEIEEAVKALNGAWKVF